MGASSKERAIETRQPRDLVPIDDVEAMQLLREASLSRVAFVHGGEPDVLPVNHLVVDDVIVFRSAAGSKLGAAAGDSRVAVEADRYDPATHAGWSVVAYGTARIVTDERRLTQLHSLDFQPWVSADRRDFWVEVVPDRIAGRRIDPS